jgi:hypothetical protein
MITESITSLKIKNTHCIICGKGFKKERAAKLYCSPSCRQSAYYHKDKIAAIRLSSYQGSNNKILSFSIEEYKRYKDYRRRLIDYRNLEKKFPQFDVGTKEWNLINKNENCGLTIARKKIPARILNLKPPYLSIEQWSFLKSLYPDLNTIEFIDFVCSLSEEFFCELSTLQPENKRDITDISFPIRNKYIHYCRKIVNGEVKFF